MFTDLLTLPYRFAVGARLWLYKQGWIKSNRLPCPVVSVGNLTVGGTGKTPMTMWVAQYLAAKGKNVAILSRGYRRKSQEKFLLVSNGKDILVRPEDAGDEPFLMATRCSGVIVAVGANRYQLGLWVLAQLKVDCFVLDDGFQHVSLDRDLNILLVDVSDAAGMQSLLPVGRLREPLSAAERATDLIFTRLQDPREVNTIQQCLESALGHGVTPITTRFEPQHLKNINGNVSHDLTLLQGQRAVIFSGVANASSFRRSVEHLGVEIVDEVIFSDHMTYTLETLRQIQTRSEKVQAQVLLTTEKDLVKVQQLWSYPNPVWAISLEVQFLEGQDKLEAQLKSL